MIRSFKLKLVLSSVLLTALLLSGLGLFSLRMSWRVGLDRMDRELRAVVDADMRKSQNLKHWERFDEALKRMYASQSEKQFLLSVSDTAGSPLFESGEWKSQIGQGETPRSTPPRRELEEKPIKKKLKNNQPVPPPRLAIGTPYYATIGNWRVMAIQNRDVSVKLGLSLVPLQEELTRFRNGLLLTIPIALLLMIISGWILAHMALRPVKMIVETAEKVTALHLDKRIPTGRADQEFRKLIEVINRMLQRLEKSFKQSTRFSADAAHELKTPLTILQGQLEAALQTAADGTDDQRTYKEALDEVQRLKTIIRKLLLLAQADTGKLTLNFQPLDLTVLIENLIEDIGILDPELEVQAEIQPGVALKADPELLGQVIQNLAGNAVKFSRGESPIRLALCKKDEVEFSISNRGQTIAPAERDKIFERFYRADKARSRKVDGTGLGLSLAREIAVAHGGSLELENSEEGVTTFILRLPANITEP